MNTLKFLIVVSIALLSINQIAYGKTNLNNGIIAPNDPEISCNKLNSNCHYIFNNQTVKITEELFKTCTIEKQSLSYETFVRLKNSIICNPVIDYYIGHNWQAIGQPKETILMVLVIAKCDYKPNCKLG
jgi:hypothetical protein